MYFTMGLFCFCYSLMAAGFPHVRQVSLEVCGSEHNSDLVHKNTYDYHCRRNCCLLVTFYLFISCQTVVFFFTQGSLNTVVGSVSAQRSYRCCLMFLAHFWVKCWGVFQHCPPGHLVIHLTSCSLFVFLPLFSVDSSSSLIYSEGMHINFQGLPWNPSL